MVEKVSEAVKLLSSDDIIVIHCFDDISFMDLTSEDVVRHRLVSEIVDAYGRFDDSVGGNRASRRVNKPRSLRSDR
jgi:phosphate starvation-inducible PhoH-like protein